MIAQLFEYGSHHILLALCIAPGTYAERYHRVDLLFDIPYQTDDFFGALHRNLDFDDRR